MCWIRDIWFRRGIGAVVLAAIPLLLLLQLWRPCFFLTDDSLTFIFPIFCRMGQNILAGQNPFFSQELFGGDYPLFKDPMFIVMYHPVVLVLSLFANTGLRDVLLDIYAMANVILAATGMRYMLARLEEAGRVGIRAGFQVFLSLSYAFSMYSLLLGSSGFWYLVNVAALPWLVGALWEKKLSRAGWIMIVAAFHNAVGGYPSCFVYSMTLVGLMLLWRALHDREYKQISKVALYLGVAGLCSMPFLLPSLMALSESTRGAAVPVEIASEHSMPIPVIFASVMAGAGSMAFGDFVLFGKVSHAYALVSFGAGWLVIAACIRPRKNWGSWDFFLLGLILLAALLVSRPSWLGEIIHTVPVLRGLRWPHKEIFLVVFLLHLFAARGGFLGLKGMRLLAFGGALVFGASLLLQGPPSLGGHAASRRLLFSGEADRYWSEVREMLSEDAVIVPVMPDEVIDDLSRYFKVPLILSGGGNFPAMYGVKTWSGYSATMPGDIYFRKPAAGNVQGIYRASDDEALLQKGLTLMAMRQEEPLEFVLVPAGESALKLLPVPDLPEH